MAHILISYKDNPDFSLYHTTLGRDKETEWLKHQQWTGFNNEGNEQYYTNGAGVSHILIQNCTKGRFEKAVADKPVFYREVKASELTRGEASIYPSCTLKLNLEAVLAKELHELGAAPAAESSVKP